MGVLRPLHPGTVTPKRFPDQYAAAEICDHVVGITADVAHLALLVHPNLAGVDWPTLEAAAKAGARVPDAERSPGFSDALMTLETLLAQKPKAAKA